MTTGHNSSPTATFSTLPHEIKARIVFFSRVGDVEHKVRSGHAVRGAWLVRDSFLSSTFGKSVRALGATDRELHELAACYLFEHATVVQAAKSFFHQHILPIHGKHIRTIDLTLQNEGIPAAVQRALAALVQLPRLQHISLDEETAALAFGGLDELRTSENGTFTSTEDHSTEDLESDADSVVLLNQTESPNLYSSAAAAHLVNRAIFSQTAARVQGLSMDGWESPDRFLPILSCVSHLTSLALEGPGFPFQSKDPEGRIPSAVRNITSLKSLSITCYWVASSVLGTKWTGGTWSSAIESLILDFILDSTAHDLIAEHASTFKSLTLHQRRTDGDIGSCFPTSSFPNLQSITLLHFTSGNTAIILSQLSQSSQIRNVDVSLSTAAGDTSSLRAALLSLTPILETVRVVESLTRARVESLANLASVLPYTLVSLGIPADAFTQQRAKVASILAKSDDVSVPVEARYAAIKNTLDFEATLLEQARADGNLWELERLMSMFELLKGRQMLSQ